jgi:phosphate transport system ATP-binding protein
MVTQTLSNDSQAKGTSANTLGSQALADARQNVQVAVRGDSVVSERSQPNQEVRQLDGERAAGWAPGLPAAAAMQLPAPKVQVENLNFFYGKFQALKNVNLPVHDKRITALIGPSGCGKSTLLRCFNRMHDLYRDSRYEGRIMLAPEGVNLIGKEMDPIAARLRVGMVFQKPNPFPKSIFENVAYGPRLRGLRNKSQLQDEVEKALRGAAIWDETKDRLQDNAMRLSGGQQQRLCIARALATTPEVVLFDEPTSALDPIATQRIEELMRELCERVTIVVVTHNMHQASRVSHYTAFMYIGELIEFNPTAKVFQNPDKKLTEDYITGRFG